MWGYIAAFVVLGIAGFIFVVRQSNESAVTGQKLDAALGDIKRTTESASDVLLPSAEHGIPVIVQSGKYPLSELSARIIDLGKWKAPVAGTAIPPTLDNGLGLPLSVGTLGVGLSSGFYDQPIQFEDRRELSFVIQFYARNGA